MAERIVPEDRADLFCDTCPARFMDRGGRARTDMAARVAGWHIYRGPSIVDSLVILTKALCPECVGPTRPPFEKITNLEHQLDLGFEVEQVLPKQKGRKHREDVS